MGRGKIIPINTGFNLLKSVNSKKAITPVVVTALLLVVAVAAVMGFQGWFQTYQSGMNTKVETQINTNLGNTKIETLVGNTLYFKNGGNSNIIINSVKIGGIDCNISKNISTGMNSLNISTCIYNITSHTPDIVVFTNNGIYQSSTYIKDFPIPVPINCSSLDGGSWIKVPGNSALGTSDFCVMKYEAKNVSGVATSQAGSTPWVSINQTDARIACANLGVSYHLITDAEWVTVARVAENNPSNWNSSVVGSGTLARGWSDTGNTAVAPSTGASCLYNNGADTCGSTGNFLYKRTLNISGNMIWDLAGNVWEWDNDTIAIASRYHGGDQQWMSYNSNDGTGKVASLVPALMVPSNGWNANQSMGRYYDGNSLAGAWNGSSYSSPTAGFLRGGNWNYGADSGTFALSLEDGPSYTLISLGFRCSYTG